MLAIYIPFLSIDRLRVSGDVDVPIATIAPNGQTMRIVHVNVAAREARVRCGQTLADAKAIVPELVTFDADPTADREVLEGLAIWAQRFSPVVHIEDDNTLLLDVTGCARLFRGEDRLAFRAVDELDKSGFSTHVAIADTPGAAWAIAHAHREPVVVTDPGAGVGDLTSLPVWSLRIDEKTTLALHKIGVRTVASLLHLPRSSLASRFGDALLTRLDQATGELPEVLTPYRARPVLVRKTGFGAPTDRLDVLIEAVSHITERFCTALDRKTAGVRSVFLTFSCPDVETEAGRQTQHVTLEISLSQPTRSASHLLSLLKVRLDTLQLLAPADSLSLWTRETFPLDDVQVELFDTGTQDNREIGDLLDRLAVRLGRNAVMRSEPISDHQPEHAFGYVPAVGCDAVASRTGREKMHRLQTGSTRGEVIVTATRPLRLLSQPCQIVTTSVVPDGPPVSFRYHGMQHAITHCVGCERIETGWWRGRHVRRDYYRVTTDRGQRVWIFREHDSCKWFLHGLFD